MVRPIVVGKAIPSKSNANPRDEVYPCLGYAHMLLLVYLPMVAANRVEEAILRTAEMRSPAWWEAHYVVAKSRPGQTWFEPLARRLIAATLRGRCLTGRAIVLGCGYSRTVELLTRHFGRAVGVDTSTTAIAAMRAARSTGRARYATVDAASYTASARLVIDEGLLDLVRTEAHLAKAWSLVEPGGHLALLGFSGDPGLVNSSALSGSQASCVVSSGRVVPFAAVRNPRLACSGWGSWLFYKNVSLWQGPGLGWSLGVRVNFFVRPRGEEGVIELLGLVDVGGDLGRLVALPGGG